MPTDDFLNTAKQSSHGAFSIIKQSLKTIREHPQILVYPYTALLFISFSYPIVSASIFARWYNDIFSEAGSIAPNNKVTVVFGLVSFSAFYTAFVSAYFNTATSAGVLAVLEGRKPPMLYGLVEVLKHFLRVTKFAVLSVFFFPMGIFAQRRKLPRGLVGVIGSSLTLHMAQIAPSILRGNQRYGATIRDSIEKTGRFWREGLALKVGMYLTIFLVVVLPKLVQHHWYKSQTASNIGWLLSLELGASGYVLFKVINSIFTAVIYHQANQK